MKAIAVFAALVAVVSSGPAQGSWMEWRALPEQGDGANMKYFLVDRGDGTYVIEDLVNAEVDLRASQSDMTYYYYSRSNPTSPVAVTAETVSILPSSFAPAKETLFIIHGWTNSHSSPVNTYIREAVLPKFDFNVFVVDWSPIAAKSYVSAQGSVVSVGNFVATFIRSLESTHRLQLSRVTLAGHSLGAHVAGNAGAALGGRVARIVGLDPAGPLFSSSNTNNRLDPTDGQFVQVIHTNNLLGMSTAIGHSDYYPNGGSSQPGCGIDLSGSCAHSRAYMYYAEGIAASANRFNSVRCESYSNYNNGRCSSNARSAMGGYPVDASARGNHYLKTNNAAPYAQG